MRAQIKEEIVLTLSIKEAIWLANVMQNPLNSDPSLNGDPNPHNEDPVIREMRRNLFFALSNVVEKTRNSVPNEHVFRGVGHCTVCGISSDLIAKEAIPCSDRSLWERTQ